MDKNDSQRELTIAAVRAENARMALGEPNAGYLDTEEAPLPMMADVSEIVMRAAAVCEGEAAQVVHAIRCLRAARGGTSGASQTAATHLAHHRLKSVPLADAKRALEESIFRTEDGLKPLLHSVVERLLTLEIHQANLRRCEEAIERRAQDKGASGAGVLPQARRVVDSLGRMGVMEGHWSTVSRTTIEKMFALIMADNVAAGVGSPDQPRMDWKRGVSEA